MLVEFPARVAGVGGAALGSAQQQTLDLASDRSHPILLRQFGRQRLVRRPHGRRDLLLDFDGQRRATRLPQGRRQELGRPPLALTIVGHQQGGEGISRRPD